MADVDVIFAPPTGYNRYTLYGTIQSDDEFPSQPVVNDQVILPDALSCDGQLNISGPVGDYTAWHITASGVITTVEYNIVNTDAPIASNPTAQVLSPSSIRFQFQTTRTGGSWYLAYSDVGMPDDGDVIDPLNEVAAVAVAGLQSVDVTGLDNDTIYYFKAVHEHPDGNSNYVSVQQGTFSTGSVSVDVVYSLPAGYPRATLIDGYDPYAIQQWAEVIASQDMTGVQLIVQSATETEYFDNLGNLWFENLDDLIYWAIFPNGTLYTLEITNLDQLGSAIPLDLDDQTVTDCEINTWIDSFDQVVLSLPDGITATATIDNSQAQHRLSTNGGSSFDAFSSTERTGLVDGDILEYRFMSGANYANSALGSDYTRTAHPVVGGAQFTLTVTNRNAVVPTITVQPQTQSVDPSDPVTLSVTANTGGLADPITYQWRKGGINISGATSSSYGIGSAVLADAGSYSVRLQSAEGGVVVSSTANLSVTPNSNVFVESAEGLVDINDLDTLLVDTEVDYEIWAGGVMVLSGTATTDPVTAKLRIESVDSVIGAAASEVVLRYPNAGSTYFHGETVTVQAG